MCGLQKSHVVEDSDDDMEDAQFEDTSKNGADVEEEPEIIESDIELDDSEVVESDNDPPQQVRYIHIITFQSIIFMTFVDKWLFCDLFYVWIAALCRWEILLWRLLKKIVMLLRRRRLRPWRPFLMVENISFATWESI